MFLNRLTEKEKLAFMEIARYIMDNNKSDGKKEQQILQTYAFEMQIDINKRLKYKNIEELLNVFHSKQHQKIALIEIMALIYADNYLDEKEESIIQALCNKFNISRNEATIYEEWTKAIIALYKQGELFINM